tara:strand:- start:274 stop:564 length:291 start_codon:yes stop_codon:yes gene_type:complete
MSDITTTLTQSSTIVGSVSQGNQPQVVRVTVPGPQGPQGASGSSQNRIGDAADVDVSTFGLNDGALLQYRAATQKWTARQELDTTSGTIVLNGGNF